MFNCYNLNSLVEHFNSPLENIKVTLPAIEDPRGMLSFIQDMEFSVERVFWIYNVPENSERGEHAHRTCTEVLFAINGSFDVDLIYGDEKQTIHLGKPNEGVLIRPMVWCRLYNFSKDFVGLCLASQKYSPEGYINSFEDFLAETAHK